jgi:arylsulfatase A-like enzyme
VTRAPRALLAGVLIATVLGLGCGARHPRNLLLISLDTLRADHLGCYGYVRPTSPFLDRLATQGVLFENAYATAPWTLPSHASLFTGLYPSQHGVMNEDTAMPEDVLTLAEALSQRGFATRAVVSGHFVGPRYGLGQGFDRYVAVPPNQPAGGAAATVIAQSLEAIAAMRGQPFLMFSHFMDVHSDYRAAPRFEALFDGSYHGRVDGTTSQLRAFARKLLVADESDRLRLIDLYDAEIRQLDTELEGWFASLRERGVLDDTLVVVTADHGEEFFEHGSVLHGQSLYQELLRVPLIVVGPGLPGGRRVAEAVSLVDVLPTVLGQLGIAPPDALAGRDLAPLWRSTPPPWPERDLYAEADRTVERRDTLRAVIRSGWKLVQSRVDGGVELYDLGADPRERVNRVPTEAERAASLAHALDSALASQKAAPALPKLSPEERAQLQALGYVQE